VSDISQHIRLSISVEFLQSAKPAHSVAEPVSGAAVQRFEQMHANVQELEHKESNIAFSFNNLTLACVLHI
jgi:hypothetical protein